MQRQREHLVCPRPQRPRMVALMIASMVMQVVVAGLCERVSHARVVNCVRLTDLPNPPLPSAESKQTPSV